MKKVLGSNRSIIKGKNEPLGKTGLLENSGVIGEEWLEKLKGKNGVKVYREMGDQDPAAAPLLNLIGTLAGNVDWTVEPSNRADQNGVDVADFIDNAKNEMTTSWGDFVQEAIVGTLQYGWGFFEKVLKQDAATGRLVWDKIELRAQETLDHWEYSEDENELVAMVQTVDGDEYTIPMDHALLFRYRARKNNPEGVSVLRAAYLPWYFGKRIRTLEAIGIENDATGMPVLEVPPELLDEDADGYSPALVSDLEKKITQIRRGEREGLLMPSELDVEGKPTGWKLRLLNSGGSRQFDMSAVIQRYRTEVAVAILYGGFLYSGTGAYGSFSLHDSQTALFSDALSGVLKGFAETFTRFAIEPLCAVNGFPQELWPKLTFSDFRKPDMASLGTLLQSMMGAGLLTPTPEIEQRLLDIAGLPHES